MGHPTLTIIFPLFGILFAGYACARIGLFSREGSEVLGKFVFIVALPSLAIVKLSSVPVTEFFNWPFLCALGGGMLIMFVIAMIVARRFFPGSLTAHGLHGLTAMYSSTGYIGLPLILIVFGDEGLVPAIIGAVITGTLFLPLGIVIGEMDRSRGSHDSLLSSLRKVIFSPILVATVIGLVISALDLTIPIPVAAALEFLGEAYVPCALFAAGLFIAGCSIGGRIGEIGWLLVAKLFLHPLITWWLAFHMLELDLTLATIAVLQAALPCGVPVFVLAQQQGVFVVRSSAVIVMSTVISMLTLSFLLVVFTI